MDYEQLAQRLILLRSPEELFHGQREHLRTPSRNLEAFDYERLRLVVVTLTDHPLEKNRNRSSEQEHPTSLSVHASKVATLPLRFRPSFPFKDSDSVLIPATIDVRFV
jgi:hypothetical protein